MYLLEVRLFERRQAPAEEIGRHAQTPLWTPSGDQESVLPRRARRRVWHNRLRPGGNCHALPIIPAMVSGHLRCSGERASNLARVAWLLPPLLLQAVREPVG